MFSRSFRIISKVPKKDLLCVSFKRFVPPTPKFSTMNSNTPNSLNTLSMGFNINDINKHDWFDISICKELDKYAPYMLIHIHKLKPKLVACSIVNSEIFAKGFIRHVISDDNIELYSKVVMEYKNVASLIFEISDDDTKSLLANYLIKNLERIKYVPHAISYSIFECNVFCELLANKIMSGDESNLHWINVQLNALTFRSMLRGLTSDTKKKFFTFLLDNKEKIYGSVLINATQIDCKFESNDTYNEILTKHIFDTKNWNLIRHVNYWDSLMDSDKLKDEWKNFILNNIVDVFSANPEVFEHMLRIKNSNFSHELIDKLIKDNLVLSNSRDVLKFLFDNSNDKYKQKLQTHYTSNAARLTKVDCYAIAQFWEKPHVNDLERKLYWLNKDGYNKSDAIQVYYI